ncbi:MAG: cytidylate kinase-like family protein [Lachnospiraceae bacterium]|nr:cytidylate kinase-like family protein [Lachnospiraceae bacterium]
MSKQLIISLSREFGSGGHLIAEKLAERFELPLYDKNLLREIAGERDINPQKLEKYDEVPRYKFFSRTVNGHSSSPEENIANLQFDFLRKKAKQGDSFVIVGRCAETVLKEFECMVPIFILADKDVKLKRIMELHNLTENEAKVMIHRENRKRKDYHNYYSEVKWGDSRNYDLSINSGRLGIDRTVDLLEQYIKERNSLI